MVVPNELAFALVIAATKQIGEFSGTKEESDRGPQETGAVP